MVKIRIKKFSEQDHSGEHLLTKIGLTDIVALSPVIELELHIHIYISIDFLLCSILYL